MGDDVVVIEHVDAGAQRVRADLMRQIVDELVSLFCRRVGLPDNVPNVATPEMLTAGPIGSVGGALRSLNVNCARVSFTVRGESVIVLLNAAVRSTFSSPADAVAVLSPPAPREFADVTLYWP